MNPVRGNNHASVAAIVFLGVFLSDRNGDRMRNQRLAITFVVCTITLILTSCGERKSVPGTVLDEARRAERTASSFLAADENYFKDMDGGIELTTNEVKGRNNWIVWTGGNDRFWDHLVNRSFGGGFFEAALVASEGQTPQPRHALEKPRPGQRALL